MAGLMCEGSTAAAVLGSRLPGSFPGAGAAAASARGQPPGGSRRTRRLLVHCSQFAVAPATSQEVEARIAVARSTGALDLSDCGLSEIPREVLGIEDLTDLSLAGNHITHLPPEIGRLKKLRRLGLAGNRLRDLPGEIGGCTALRGLWVHGNLLHSIPDELGSMSSLQFLALAGNRLPCLPPSLCSLTALQVLSVAGNALTQLPGDLGNLSSLRILAAHGNFLQDLPPTLPLLAELQDLWLQGNCLESIPGCLAELRQLKQLSLADNAIAREEPDALLNVPVLQVLYLYGNKLQAVPSGLKWAFASTPRLSHIWLEGNPLDPESLRSFLQGSARPMKGVGVDRGQLHPFGSMYVESLGPHVRVGESLAPGRGGYFKLQPWRRTQKADTLVVAFGSAPGVPNWGGLLKRVKGPLAPAEGPPMASPPPAEVSTPFDILYVVDPARRWYTSAAESAEPEFEEFRSRLKEATAGYRRVVMLGDSMGASAALVFSDLADKVLAFCPQVDLESASIRPGQDSAWLRGFKHKVLESVGLGNEGRGEQTGGSSGKANGAHVSETARRKEISVHCGNWAHDLGQARLVEGSPQVKLVVHNVDDHRLAKELDSRGQLQELVRQAIQG